MKKIAVVEDDEYIGNMLCELLREKAVRSLFYGRKRPRVHGLGLSIAKLFVERMGGGIGAFWSAGRLSIRMKL